ncbi:MAG: NADH-quinone oxidoreductase subunit N [Planctomycetota bacterium]|jgi:NADH-quinone oxidoreductase subunit N
MADKLWFLIPEIWLFLGVFVLSVMGLARTKFLRDALPLVVCAFLAVALVAIPLVYTQTDRLSRAAMLMPSVGYYVKMVVCAMGIVLALLSVGLIDRRLEEAVKSGRARFDPIRVSRGEYFAFFLLSLIGAMLVCNANDLIWLFLALELTSLPTYVMVAISRPSRRAQEAAVKYFFLGALAAAMFLYGFALLYGSTGTIVLTEMREALTEQAAAGGLNRMAIVGMILAVVGTAFLGFVPKTAGAVAIILLLGTVGWSGHLPGGTEGLPQPILITLWMIAVLTMTLGNVGAMLQRSAKRLLAYSSIAHSGYLLIGVIAGPGLGINSVLFYLLVYGVMNTAAFAALAALERRGEEVEALEDLAGLRLRHRTMSVVIVIAAGSLIGFPPLLGFWGKLLLLIAGVKAGHLPLVVIAVINSAISAWYYLRLAGLPILAMPGPQAETIVKRPVVWPRVAAVLTGLAVLIVPIFVERLVPDRDMTAATPERPPTPDLTLGAPPDEEP